MTEDDIWMLTRAWRQHKGPTADFESSYYALRGWVDTIERSFP